ncbi:putative nickel-responsive regulator [Candidatus Nitrosocaldus cavascurensis]|uniref:Putative nickel-responsive regulator n=1 Tax=Candidatus Nitrosocaldus cavascurensis TaxID=2058097 RepID=A0A2K5APB6_9ARCH|nr:putative nickel-responsive regulator [Candidatus Nitrosocaldus cavascurensis]
MVRNSSNSKSGVVRISISLPSDLLASFERVSKKAGFTDRSKAIQTAMRAFISENEWLSGNESGKGAGLIELLYDPHTRNIEKALTLIQHNYNHIVTASTHMHLDDDNCLEAILVRGDARSIKRLVKELVEKKGIKSIKVNFVKVI